MVCSRCLRRLFFFASLPKTTGIASCSSPTIRASTWTTTTKVIEVRGNNNNNYNNNNNNNNNKNNNHNNNKTSNNLTIVNISS